MADRLTSAEFARRHDLPDWRILLQGIETWFVAPSFVDAVAFIGEIAEAAEAANHHPDLDLRYRRLHVRLTSHDAGRAHRPRRSAGGHDLRAGRRPRHLRRAPGQHAPGGGHRRPRHRCRAARSGGPRWATRTIRPTTARSCARSTTRPASGPAFWFQQMDAPARSATASTSTSTCRRTRWTTASRPPWRPAGRWSPTPAARAFWVLADPEGNEACLCTWEDRELTGPGVAGRGPFGRSLVLRFERRRAERSEFKNPEEAARAHLQPQGQRDHPQVARRRCRRPRARPARHRGRPRPARQAQARVRPAHRHRRPRDRDQRRQGRAHRQQGRAEDRLPALRLPGRAQGADVRRRPRPPSPRRPCAGPSAACSRRTASAARCSPS